MGIIFMKMIDENKRRNKKIGIKRENNNGIWGQLRSRSFIVKILICYNIVDMKFLKQTQRSKAWRKFSAQEDVQNIDPNISEKESTHKGRQAEESMEIEEKSDSKGEEEVYQEGIINYLVQHQETLKVEGNYFLRQPDIT